MLKLKFLFPLILVLTVAGAGGVYYAATRAGLSIVSAAPDTIVPASADMYVGVNRGGDQGTALTRLWNTYRAHAGTVAALDHLASDMRKQNADPAKLDNLLSSLGDQAGVAIWLPPSGSTADPSVAMIAQVKVTDLLTGKNPLKGNATTTPLWAYQGTQVYNVAFNGGGKAWGCIVSGDGVVATDEKTIKSVIDAATGHATVLSSNTDYKTTVAALPAARSLSVYVAPIVSRVMSKEMASSNIAVPAAMRNLAPRIPVRPYGAAVVASNDGLSLSTTALPSAGTTAATTPNEAASIFGASTILYTSQANLAGTIEPYLRLLPGNTLAQMEKETGINLRRDILGWMNGEFAIGLSDDTSPILGQFIGSGMMSGGNRSAAAPAANALPGSLSLAWHVDNPVAVRGSLDRIAATAKRMMGGQSNLVSQIALPNGSQGYAVAGMPSVGYAISGNWLMATSNLGHGVSGGAALANDATYKAALAQVSGAFSGVGYVNVTRLLGALDKWSTFADSKAHGAISQVAKDAGWSWPQAEPLIAPIQSVLTVSHPSGTKDMTVQAFVTIQ